MNTTNLRKEALDFLDTLPKRIQWGTNNSRMAMSLKDLSLVKIGNRENRNGRISYLVTKKG